MPLAVSITATRSMPMTASGFRPQEKMSELRASMAMARPRQTLPRASFSFIS